MFSQSFSVIVTAWDLRHEPAGLNCTICGQLILRKIIKIVATRCQILRLKCIKFNFGWSSTPDRAGGSLQRSPRPLAGFKGLTSKGREGMEGKGGEGGGEGERVGRVGKGKGGKRRGKGGDVEGPGKWSAPGPALAVGGAA